MFFPYQDAPVQPHHSTIILWDVLFGHPFHLYKVVKDFQFHEISFVREPADPAGWADPKKRSWGFAIGGKINE